METASTSQPQLTVIRPKAIAYCKNCGAVIDGRYCSKCGQDTNLKRLSVRLFIEDVLRFFVFKRGVLYTIKEMTLHPGITMRDYIRGKRQSHSLPFTYLLTTITVATILSMYFNISVHPITHLPNTIVQMVFSPTITMLINNFFDTYLTISLLGVIPIISGVSYYVYQRVGYNFTELVVSNIFMFAHIIAIYVVLTPFNLFSAELFYTMFFFTAVSYLMYSYLRFFKVGLIMGVRKFIITFSVSYLLYGMLLFLILLTYFVNTNWELLSR